MIDTNTMPFRLCAQHALTDALKEITPANGYVFDLSDFDPGDGAPLARVYRGRAWFGDNDPIPMVSILEATDIADVVIEEPEDDGTGEFDWHILIQGFVTDDPANPTDPAYKLMRDVRRRLNREKNRTTPGRHTIDPLGSRAWGFPGCRVTRLTIGLGTVRPADDISSKAYFALRLTIRLVEDPETA